eukprot:2668439-Amphidinium_carterae.1
MVKLGNVKLHGGEGGKIDLVQDDAVLSAVRFTTSAGSSGACETLRATEQRGGWRRCSTASHG